MNETKGGSKEVQRSLEGIGVLLTDVRISPWYSESKKALALLRNAGYAVVPFESNRGGPVFRYGNDVYRGLAEITAFIAQRPR